MNDLESGYEVIGETDPYLDYLDIDENNMMTNYEQKITNETTSPISDKLTAREDSLSPAHDIECQQPSLLESVSLEISKMGITLQDTCREPALQEETKNHSSRKRPVIGTPLPYRNALKCYHKELTKSQDWQPKADQKTNGATFQHEC